MMDKFKGCNKWTFLDLDFLSSLPLNKKQSRCHSLHDSTILTGINKVVNTHLKVKLIVQHESAPILCVPFCCSLILKNKLKS